MKKPALIFIHGLRGDHYGLLEIADALRADFEIYTPDLPGYGEHEALGKQTTDSYSEWLHEYVTSLNLSQKPVMIGHSMGSIIVSHYLKKYPKDTNEKAILLAPIARSEKQQKRSDRTAKILCDGMRRLMNGHQRYRLLKSKFIAFIISRYLTYDRTRQKYIDRQHYEHSGRFTSTKAVIADIELSMKEQSTFESDKKLLLCMGDHDRLTKVENVKKRKAGHKNIKLEVIPGTGHLLNYEQPNLCADIIRKFLS